jgi:CRP/FNR family transcriptional regulator/CRP/FNR family cyclic AMP-dependent transcriptional regulator
MGAADFLTEYKSFKDFDKDDLASLGQSCSQDSYAKDDVLFQEEAPGDRMHIIKSGTVKIVKKVKDKENTIAVLNPGEFFGEMALLDGMPRSAGAKAGEAVTVITISRANYAALRDRAPKTALKLMDILVNVLSNRLRQTNKNLEAMAFLIE